MNQFDWIEHITQWETFLTERRDNAEDNGARTKANRQLKALNYVRYAAVLNPKLLVEFINPSEIIAPTAEVSSFFLELDESQENAVKMALGESDLSLIQGPPGTGKTQVIAEICLQLYKQNPDVRILVCSETHVAVNNLISRISEYNDSIRIVRIHDKEQDSSVEGFLPESIVNDYIEWLGENCPSADTVRIISQSLSDPEDKSLEKALALSANIVGMTCNRVGAYEFESSSEMFDAVIIDEVCKATLPEILMPLTITRKAVLVGDPKQLPPVFCSEEIDIIKGIEKCHLQNYMYIDKLFDRAQNVTVLNTQYRMSNQIGSLIGNLFYDGRLKNGRNVDIDGGIVWVDYSPSQAWPDAKELRSDNPKIFNCDECEIIATVIGELEYESEVKTVAIISPYKQQVALLRKQMNSVSSAKNISVDTVDGFQGKECDAVVFSLTRTAGSYRFFSDIRRLNVALSRARDRIFIVGCLEYATKNPFLKSISILSKTVTHSLMKDPYEYRIRV